MEENKNNRRGFLKSTALLSVAIVATPTEFCLAQLATNEDNINIVGPKAGFTPQIGTLISMMAWMRNTMLASVQKLTIEQLDYVHDEKANSIGAMLFHLAATERFYQVHTFEGKKWGDWDQKDKDKFEVASALGDEARKKIKGNPLKFYLDLLKETRQHSIDQFKKRDDKWLMSVDKDWPWGPTNNYCKWFHVCEHESNHNGQIKWIAGRLPS